MCLIYPFWSFLKPSRHVSKKLLVFLPCHRTGENEEKGVILAQQLSLLLPHLCALLPERWHRRRGSAPEHQLGDMLSLPL